MNLSESQVKMLWRMGALIVLVLALNLIAGMQAFRNMTEDITYRIDPNPARAFEYGERHFSSRNPKEYDVERAAYWFERAAAQTPSDIPYLYHELARISFLKGDFRKALSQIDLQISLHGDETANSYYVRGLIEGYMGLYEAAIEDYRHFLYVDPHNWAAINDYAWVLLKAGRAREATVASAGGLAKFPDNAWLLNTNAIALYEIGLLEPARAQARKAVAAVSRVTERQWLIAYPGNDPKVAAEGITALQASALQNMHTISLAIASSTVQSMHE